MWGRWTPWLRVYSMPVVSGAESVGLDRRAFAPFSMKVFVTIALTVPALKKHWRQMRGAARVLTDAKNSVQVSQSARRPKQLSVSFSVPKARQAEVVDGFALRFWSWMEDYGTCSISFESEPRRKRRSGKSLRRLP